jgi:hypothetical protein
LRICGSGSEGVGKLSASSSQWLIAIAMKPNDLLGIAKSRPDLLVGSLHRFLQNASHHLGTMTFAGADPYPRRKVSSALTPRSQTVMDIRWRVSAPALGRAIAGA